MTKPMPIIAVAAMSRNRVIGRSNTLPWHLPEDLKIFKARTMGKPVIMGRRTFESIMETLGQPMPGRHSIVISRGPWNHPAVNTHTTLASALVEARAWAIENGAEEIIIGGGGQIYELALPLTDRIFLTIVDMEAEGDTYFPLLDEAEWQETGSERHENSDPTFTIHTFDRI